jgi:hypothetical protein
VTVATDVNQPLAEGPDGPETTDVLANAANAVIGNNSTDIKINAVIYNFFITTYLYLQYTP